MATEVDAHAPQVDDSLRFRLELQFRNCLESLMEPLSHIERHQDRERDFGLIWHAQDVESDLASAVERIARTEPGIRCSRTWPFGFPVGPHLRFDEGEHDPFG